MCLTGDEDVVQVYETEPKVSQHLIHHALERLSIISEAKRHPTVLKEAERCCHSRLHDVLLLHRDLVVPLSEVELGEHRAASQSGHQVPNVRAGVPVWYCL